MKYIYHITTQQIWKPIETAHLQLEKIDYVSPSFEADGFTRCFTSQQLPSAISTLYKDVSDLIVLEIIANRLISEVKWQTSDIPELYDEDELFPYVYGAINKAAILDAISRPRGGERIDDWLSIPLLEFHETLRHKIAHLRNTITGFTSVLLKEAAYLDEPIAPDDTDTLRDFCIHFMQSGSELRKVDFILGEYSEYLHEQREQGNS
ncbi:MAG: DUF952 domain-containing protein [Aggregatilineales bacterium]